MKMMHTINRVIICGLTFAVVSFLSNAVAEEQATPKEEGIVQQQEANKWGEAGKEVKEAAGSVAEATTETAGTAWDTVKTESVDIPGQSKPAEKSASCLTSVIERRVSCRAYAPDPVPEKSLSRILEAARALGIACDDRLAASPAGTGRQCAGPGRTPGKRGSRRAATACGRGGSARLPPG